MAQSGYTPILVYASGTASNVPLAANLTSSASGAELALNYADGKLYFKNSSGVVTLLASSATVAPVTTLSFGTTGLTPSTATSGAITVAGTLATTNGGTGLTSFTANRVFYSSSTSAIGQSANLTFDGTTLVTANFTDSSLTSGRVTYATTGGNLTDSANLLFDGTTLTANALTTTSTVTINGGTANGVAYLNGSKVLTTGSALTFDGTSLGVGIAPAAKLDVSGVSGGIVYFRGTGDAYQEIAGGGRTPGTGSLLVGQGNAGEAYLWNRFNSYTAFGVNNSEQMRLTSTGLGIGTSSPSYKLDVQTSAGRFQVQNYGAGSVLLYSNGVLAYNAATTRHEWQVAGSTLMQLESSGNLGIGTSSPGTKLDVVGAGTVTSGTMYSTIITRQDTTTKRGIFLGYDSSGQIGVIGTDSAGAAASIAFWTYNGSAWGERMRLDSSGNLGLGVTPSAWSTLKAMQFPVGSIAAYDGGASNRQINLINNAYYDGANYRYVATDTAQRYTLINNQHQWYNAPSGTAGNAITFTQAMTLDASGQLGIGTTSPGFTLDISAAGPRIRQTATTGTNSSLIQLVNTGGTAYIGLDNSAGGISTAYALNFYHSGAYPIVFSTSGTERARITSGGYFKASNSGTYAGSTASYHELYSNASGDWIGYFTQATATNPNGVVIQYTAAAPNGTGNTFLYCQDNAAVRATIRSNGGIANYSANDVNLSDRREKINFAPAKSYLDTICAIPVQTFNYIDQSEDDPGLTLGVVAQDVQAVAPELVMESNWGTEDNPKMRLSIYQTDLQYALMKALQELKAEFDAYKATHP